MVAGRNASPKDEKNTERLKGYWTSGEGGAKIRWGEGGDFDRCVRLVTKAVKGKMSPEDVKGFCQNRHQEATGMSTSEHAKRDRAAKGK